MRILLLFFLSLLGLEVFAQDSRGILEGSVVDPKQNALASVTVHLISLNDSSHGLYSRTDPTGNFQITGIPFGYYRLRLSSVGFRPLTLDSIHFRAERNDFHLQDLIMQTDSANSKMEEIIIYAEKPLIQSKDGNITFNAGESALSAGSNASELLTSVPLITKDPTGKLLVRGKEPKILIDDKPVELNLQQLQDMLESMPGSSIEKIEVMTNPPPQYASEQGGVINIVTRKGTVGFNGRVSLYGGTRGEAGVNTGLTYRRKGLAVNLNAGGGYNSFETNGYSRRENIFSDSSNYLHTESNSRNRNIRPNLRLNINYDPSKRHAFNLVFQYNQNDFRNQSFTSYTNLDRNKNTTRNSTRSIHSTGHNVNPSVSGSYTMKTAKAGESLRFLLDVNRSLNNNDRDFYQQYLQGFGGNRDSTQEQLTRSRATGSQLRVNYELPLGDKATFLSFGTFHNRTHSDVRADASYRKSATGEWMNLDALTNHFGFRQQVTNLRASVKHVFADQLSLSTGINAEQTNISFDLFKSSSDTGNRYWSLLPFASLNKNWKDRLSLTFSYRRTIRRPGINELNPTIDFSDPYNTRFGNPLLLASSANNFDLVLGRNRKRLYSNLAFGYNQVQDIFAQVRTLLTDGRTQTTWENISGRKEYEVSTWSGYTFTTQFRLNLSASYTYNQYSSFDKMVRNYRNGGSLTSNLNANYVWKTLYTVTGNFTFNRFANPQGTVRSSLSMNVGLQARLLRKKLAVTLNVIDPFQQQQSRVFTYGSNFALESVSTTQTRNFRLTLGYSFAKKQKSIPRKASDLLRKPARTQTGGQP